MEESPQRRSGLTKEETRTSLESFNWSMSFRSVFITLCGGTALPFSVFVLSLGLVKEKMGFVVSLASLACIIQMVSLIGTTRVRNRKKFILSVAVAEPLLMIGAVMVVPFLPAQFRLYALVAVIFLAAASMHLTMPLTEEWLATTIPAGVRGRYLGKRFQIMSAAIIVAYLAGGLGAEWAGQENTFGLACILAVGGVFGVAAVVALRGATMPAASATSRVEWSHIPNTMRSRTFRRCLLGIFLYNMPFFFAVPYYQVMNVKVLGMRESHISYVFAAYYLVRVFLTPMMGRWLDRTSARRGLLVFGPAYVLFFIGLCLSVEGRVWPMVAAWIVAGIGDACYIVAVTSAVYGAVPSGKGRPAYFAVFNLFNLATYGVGALVAVPVLKALRGVSISIGPVTLDQFQIFFALCGVMMIFSTFGACLLPRGRDGR